MILKYKKIGSRKIKGVLEAENIVNTVDGIAIMLDQDEFDLVAKGDKKSVEWIEYCKKNKGIFLLEGLHETCCECGRVLNAQTDECFRLENGDVFCEDCVDYQIYTKEMEMKTKETKKDKKLEERLERIEELLQQIGGEIFEIKSKQGKLDRDYCDLSKDMENIERAIQKREELICKMDKKITEWIYRENEQKRFRR